MITTLLLHASVTLANVASLALLPAAVHPAQEPGTTQRPGLVLIPGGTTVVGADLDATIERIREMPAAANVLAGEAPRSEKEVGTFYISPTLVTNEMYLEYVKDTGAMPPPAWAVISPELRKELIKAGKDREGPGFVFDDERKAQWWINHWQDEGRDWKMDPSSTLEPVVSISFLDAQGYCAWAGVRIPTELEWTRAARGDTSFDYPFGDAFDRKLISHNATKPSNLAYKLLPVCSMQNASPFGIYDMVGLVHEYTDSRATKLDGWKSFTVDFLDEKGKVVETKYPSPMWDSSRILIKGGSYRNQSTNCRIDTRIGFDRDASATIVGFRVAASATPLTDSAYLRCQDLRSSVIGGTPASILDFDKAVGVEKHSYRDLSVMAGLRAPHEEVKEIVLPDSYAVFGPHTSLSITPLKDPFKYEKHAKLNAVDKNIRRSGRMVSVAALYTDVALQGYDVPAGAYALVYMPGMKRKDILAWGGWVKGTERELPNGEGEGEGDKEKKDDAKVKPSVDISDVELVQGKQHLLIVNRDSKAIAALPLIGRPAYAKDQKVDHGIAFRPASDKQTAAIIFDFKVPGSRGYAYGFSVELSPVDEDGKNLSEPSAWNPVL
jgi:formylglycine-generating enzyme required for sulfatase activity